MNSPSVLGASALASLGTRVDTIPVQLSYQIIKHFSAGLYSSPNKAIEELVSNSYDAWARTVHVILPDDISAPHATIWVLDDGQSMDVDGFRELWKIGESTKRDPGRESQERPPIGKFGIGKLATYVLAKQLTYVCKHAGTLRAVTMDFSLLEAQPHRRRLSLQVRELQQHQAEDILGSIAPLTQNLQIPFRLFGRGAARTWTAAALTTLTPLARKLTPGRLKRVLKTALPISPQFNLYFNGEQLTPEKVDRPQISQWIIGSNDAIATDLDFDSAILPSGQPGVRIPQLGPIWGEVQLFEDPLTGGKSEWWGRSHGFFVLVRKRLINLHDELFGLEALSHGAFSRFRMVVHADGLDNYLRATRETVSEDEEGVQNFRAYLKDKFNEARSKYEDWLVSQEAERSVSRRISSTPRSLSRQPLLNAIRGVLEGSISGLVLTQVPKGLTESQKATLLAELEESIASDNFFTDVTFEALGVDRAIAIFDVATRRFKVNILHPFFANYSYHYRSPEPFQLLAITEVLTEAYLLDEGLSPDQAIQVLSRRDRFLRELVYSSKLSAPLVALLLDDKRNDRKGLERAVGEGLRSLGFEVSPMAGSGEPDGIALARLGVRDDTLGTSHSYSVTYDAKSTGKDRVSAKDVNAATIAQHRDANGAQFALVVAPGFEGDGASDSNCVVQAVAQQITLLTIDDFMRLVLIASTRPLGFERLRDDFFSKCRGPLDGRTWIQRLLTEDAPSTPLPEILDAIWEMQKDSPDPPRFAAVRERLASRHQRFQGLRARDIQDWMTSVHRFTGTLVSIDGDRVYLNLHPERILDEVRGHTGQLPAGFLAGSIYAKLGPPPRTPPTPRPPR